jgi:hypothetical protein
MGAATVSNLTQSGHLREVSSRFGSCACDGQRCPLIAQADIHPQPRRRLGARPGDLNDHGLHGEVGVTELRKLLHQPTDKNGDEAAHGKSQNPLLDRCQQMARS